MTKQIRGNFALIQDRLGRLRMFGAITAEDRTAIVRALIEGNNEAALEKIRGAQWFAPFLDQEAEKIFTELASAISQN